MEVKKNEHVDLEKKKGIFFQIGLILSMGLILMAFEWQSPMKKAGDLSGKDQPVDSVLIPINTTQDKPVPPKPEEVKIDLFPELNKVDNDEDTEDIFIPLDPEEFEVYAHLIPDFIDTEEVIEEDVIFVTVQTMPKFRGGDLGTFLKYVMSMIRYPQIAIDNSIQGVVFVEFVVNEKGKVVNILTQGGADPVLKNEALRVVKSSPKWEPGYQMDKAVKVRMTLPVKFKLN